jgi:hypothetical protein
MTSSVGWTQPSSAELIVAPRNDLVDAIRHVVGQRHVGGGHL